MRTNSPTMPWLQKGVLAGLALIALGLLLPPDVLIGALTDRTSESPDQLRLGALLFKAGLVFHGLLLAAVTATWPSWAVPHGGKARASLWTVSIPRETGGRNLRGLLVVAGLLGAGAALRAINLGSGLWYDEVVTLVEFVRPSLGQIFTGFASDNQHTFFSLLAHGSVALFGESPWALRLPAVLFGLAGIWALYALASTIASEHEALLAAALLTVSYHHIWFSQNARGYTGLLFFTLLATWLFVRGLQDLRLGLWVGYAVAMTLGVYTHLTMAFVLTSHVLAYGWVLVGCWRRGEHLTGPCWIPVFAFALVGSLSFQLYALVLPQVMGATVNATTVPSDWTNPLWALAETLRGMKVGFAGGVGGLAAAGLFASGLLSYARENRFIVALLVLPGLLGAAVVILLQRNFWPRFFFYTMGFLVLIAVRGAMVIGGVLAGLVRRSSVDAALGRRIGVALTAGLILLSAASLPIAYRYPKQDYQGALAFVEQRRQPGEAVVAVGLASLPYQRFYAPYLDAIRSLDELNAIRSRSRATWLLYTFPIHLRSRHPDILDSVGSNFRLVKIFPGTVGDGAIYVWRSAEATRAEGRERDT